MSRLVVWYNILLLFLRDTIIFKVLIQVHITSVLMGLPFIMSLTDVHISHTKEVDVSDVVITLCRGIIRSRVKGYSETFTRPSCV